MSPLLTCFPRASQKTFVRENLLLKGKFPPFETFCCVISLILYEHFVKSENKEDTANISGNM